ncbi:MAG TPA: MBL fold metallo-hydrolase [Gemmatimonadaceae bacterium]|nr:MBL fold metallo-hydrolase [Gemmatimonadaceae bacterium]
MTNAHQRLAVASCMAFAAAATAATAQLPTPAGSPADAFVFREVRPDIYHAIGTGRMAVGANAAIIINEGEVLVVDSHVSPAAATALLGQLARITAKPVRYVVNTHFHFDHVHGNQVYPRDVEIIGHEFTREVIARGGSVSGRGYDRFVGGLPAQIAALRREIAAATDTVRRAELERRLAVQEAYLTATNDVRPTAPTTTLATRMTLHRGEREIRLLFFGRGHTGGDVVVHLPRERLVITGDLLVAGLPYMGDGYLLEWAETLEHVKALDFDVILPGHGEPFSDRRRIDHLQAYLRDLWTRTAALHTAGVPADEAAERIDMRDHAANFPAIRQIGADRDAVARVYELLSRGR